MNIMITWAIMANNGIWQININSWYMTIIYYDGKIDNYKNT